MFFVSFGVDLWNKNLLRRMFNKFKKYVKKPDYKKKLVIYTDGNEDYSSVLPEYYDENYLDYGQKVKSLGIKRKVFGDPDLDDINTNVNECFNTILRARLSRLVRKSQCHAKDKYALNSALYLFQFHWNFMHVQHNKKLTPAMIEGISNKVWTWGNFLHEKLKYLS